MTDSKASASKNKIRLVAHRGYAARYPENTLIAIQQAISLGACGIEVDVQLTKDEVPVLCHDDNLQRVAGVDRRIVDITAREFVDINMSEPDRLGMEFTDNPSASLAQLVEIIKQHADRVYFIEIKQESLDVFGFAKVADRVHETLMPVQASVSIISYNLEFLLQVRERLGYSIGWVLTRWDDEALDLIDKTAPNYVICNFRKIPQGYEQFSSCSCEWMLYEMTAISDIQYFANLGVTWMESMQVEALAQDPLLKPWLCLSDDANS